jgi:hypothetical protein
VKRLPLDGRFTTLYSRSLGILQRLICQRKRSVSFADDSDTSAL